MDVTVDDSMESQLDAIDVRRGELSEMLSDLRSQLSMTAEAPEKARLRALIRENTDEMFKVKEWEESVLRSGLANAGAASAATASAAVDDKDI